MSEAEAEPVKVECEPTCSSKEEESKSSEYLDKLFSTRYTEEDPHYAETMKGFDPIIMMHPYHGRPKRVFDYTNRDRGGYRGNNGSWRRNNGNWRGNRDRRHDNRNYDNRRDYNNRSSGFQGSSERKDDGRGPQYSGSSRTHYPGRY